MYEIRVLSNEEFDNLSEEETRGSNIHDSLGFANKFTGKAYVRQTGAHELNKFLVNHELEELESADSSHEDENGIRHKKGPKFFKEIVAPLFTGFNLETGSFSPFGILDPSISKPVQQQAAASKEAEQQMLNSMFSSQGGAGYYQPNFYVPSFTPYEAPQAMTGPAAPPIEAPNLRQGAAPIESPNIDFSFNPTESPNLRGVSGPVEGPQLKNAAGPIEGKDLRGASGPVETPNFSAPSGPVEPPQIASSRSTSPLSSFNISGNASPLGDFGGNVSGNIFGQNNDFQQIGSILSPNVGDYLKQFYSSGAPSGRLVF